MFNFNIDKNKRYTIQYNTREGVKTHTGVYKNLKIIEDQDGKYKNLEGTRHYSIAEHDEDDAIYMYRCLYNDTFNKPNYYLNTVLQPGQLPTNIWDELTTPKLIYYDIETNEHAIHYTDKLNDAKKEKNKQRKKQLYNEAEEIGKNVKVNSIAWITENDNEYILIRDIDGTERQILNKFVNYCKDHNIMGLVGHNSYGFDDVIMSLRCRHNGISRDIFYNNCNLDTLKLAQLLQYTPKGNYLKLNDLADILQLEEHKTDINDNPIILYNEGLEDPATMHTFKEYNIQDVRVTKLCFERMESLKQINALFLDTLTPFNKQTLNSVLLNGYTCKNALKDGLVVPESVEKPIKFENEGGLNYYINEKNKELTSFNNILVLDVVSYYPHLLMLIGADPTHEYNNINRDSGYIDKFDEVPNGYLARLSRELYEGRAKIKEEMRNTTDAEERDKLDHQQKTKKIIVNSLYGVLSQKGNYYILKNELLGATITAIGRDVLDHVIKEFKAVYGKTDSVFIPIDEDTDVNQLLNDVNTFVSDYLYKRYTLTNVLDDKPIIRFEVDAELKKLIIKDKNNYIKVFKDDTYKLKGGSFDSSSMSEFEHDLNEMVINYVIDKDEINKNYLVDSVTDFTSKQIESGKPLNYYAEVYKLSVKRKGGNFAKDNGREYMDDHEIKYNYESKYLICRVSNYKHDFIMFPKGYTVQDVELYKPYPYELTARRLKAFGIFTDKEVTKYKRKYGVKKAKNKKLDKQQSKLTDLHIHNDTDFTQWEDNNVNNTKLLQLNKLITDTKEYYNKGLIKFVAVEEGTKKAKVPRGTVYTHEYITKHKKVFDITKFNKNDNIAIIRGFNGVRILDIDGRKYLTVKQNEALKKYLLDILTNGIDYPFIIQQTQRKGFTLLYYDNTDTPNSNLSNIYFPTERPADLPAVIDDETYKTKLAGQSFGAGTIETFTKLNGLATFTPSKGEKGNYKLISKGCTWSQIFDKPVTDIFTKIDEAFKRKGFKVTNRTVAPGHGAVTFKRKRRLKILESDEVNEIITLMCDLMKLADKYNAKHYTAVSIGGYFSNNISLTNTEHIVNGVINGVGDIMDDVEIFKRDILDNYEREVIKKTFTRINEVTNNDETVINVLNKIRDIIEDERGAVIDISDEGNITVTPTSEESTPTIASDENEIKKLFPSLEAETTTTTDHTHEYITPIPPAEPHEPTPTNTDTPVRYTVDANRVYEYSNKSAQSFLTADSEVIYAINSDHLDKLERAKDELIKCFKNADRKHIVKLINGGFKHFALPYEYTIPGYETETIYDPNNVYTIGQKNKLYGFPKISEIIDGLKSLDYNHKKGKKTIKFKTFTGDDVDEDEQNEAHKKLNNLKYIINDLTILNPSYYVCRGYTQQNNEILSTSGKGRGVFGYFAFKNIEVIKQFNPVNSQFSNNKTYNFTIKDYNKHVSEYENVTIEDLQKELFNKKLLISDAKTYTTHLIRFIIETDKKQKLKRVTLPVCPGIFYNDGAIISYFPKLENEYTLRDGVICLNDTFTNVFNNKSKYGTIYWSCMLQTLNNVFKDLNLAQLVNRHNFLLGAPGTFKTTILNMIPRTFDNSVRIEESNEGDSPSAISRSAGLSTLPLINDDPRIKINDHNLKSLLKNMAFGYVADVLASEQYGNEINRRDSFRLCSITHNDTNLIIDKKDGEHRRVNIALFTLADTPTPQQKQYYNQYTHIENGRIYLNRLTAIGYEFISFITNYFNTWSIDKRNKIVDTGGWCIIDEFIKHLEDVTDIKLCSGLKTRYEWDDLSTDENVKLYTMIRYDFEKVLKGNNIPVTYDTEGVKNYVSLCHFLSKNIETRGDKTVTKYYLRRNEFLDFVKSPACLNRHVTDDELITMLGLENIAPKGFTEKRGASRGGRDQKKPRAIELTLDEILAHLLDEEPTE